MTNVTIEKIQTGLTANYVPYWTVVQGLKEAMQNIAYGSVKSGKPAKLYFDKNMGMWAIKDKYVGFEKRHLYIGESEQRDDKDGLGTFGEGWKIFLLVMARNGINHLVRTVGFTFWGTMEPTPHGTEVLVINIEPNENKEGTKVFANVPEEQWRKATESFAVLQSIDGYYIKHDSVIPNRKHELWVQGVRIEQDDNTNPLNLYYSYNLCQRDLINRDRSHVNTELAYHSLKSIVFEMEEDQVKEFVLLALNGNQHEDILRGPEVPLYDGGEQKRLWLETLAELHATEPGNLAIPSYNQAVNDEAKRKGYVLLDTPRRWDYEMTYLGIKKADDIVDDRYNIVEDEVYSVTKQDKSALAKARTKLKRAFGLSSVSELPPFQYVKDIKSIKHTGEKKAYYDPEIEVVFITTEILSDEYAIVEALIPELIVWHYDAVSSESFERACKQVIMNLLF